MITIRNSGLRRNKANRAQATGKAAVGVAIASVVALFAAACSSSSTSTAAATGATSGATGGASLTGAPIKVGTIMSSSGAYGDPTWAEMATIWEKWTNANGGINGHPVDLIVDDDQSSTTTGLQDAKQLVEQQHVVAIIGASAVSVTSWAPYLAAKNIPLIGGEAATAFGAPANVFGASLGIPAELVALFDVAKLAGADKAAQIYATSAVSGPAFLTESKQAAASVGVDLVYASGGTPTQPDFTAACLGAKSSGAQTILLGIPSVTEQIVKTCRTQGYTGSFLSDAGLLAPSMSTDTSISSAKIYSVSGVWPFFVKSTPSEQAYFKAISTYDPSLLTNPGYDPYNQVSWVGFEMFKAAAVAGGIGPNSTSADLTNALYKVKNETLGGLTGPTTYTAADKSHLGSCYFVSELSGGQWTTPFGTAAHCLTNS